MEKKKYIVLLLQIAAVAAAFMAGHAFRSLAFCHLGEDKVCLIAEAFIR